MRGMGFLKGIGAALELTRFNHALMLAFAVLIAEIAALGGLPPFELAILLSLLVPVLSEMGAFALNDYLDIETDRMNGKTDRPLVRGDVSPPSALLLSIACIALALLTAWPINTAVLSITIVFNALSVLYNWKLKDLPLLGNVYIGLSMAIPFVFGSLVVSDTVPPLMAALAGLAFIAGLARELIKSAQDMEGDRAARGSSTLPLLIGERPAVLMAVGLYLLFMALSILPFHLGLAGGMVPMMLVGAADLMIAHICARLILSGKEAYRYARNASLMAFMAGMCGMLLSSLL